MAFDPKTWTPPAPGQAASGSAAIVNTDYGSRIFDTFGMTNIGVKMLVYGKAGVGKTRLCMTAPAPIVLSAERGLLTLRKYHVAAIEVQSLADLKGIRQYLTTRADFMTLCIDSVTDIAETVLSYEQKNTSNGQRAYGQMAEQIMEELREFRNLPKHVIFTAQMGSKKDGLTGGMMWGPSFPGQVLDQKVPYLFDEMFQLEGGIDPATGERYGWLRTQPDRQYEAKDRSGVLAPWEHSDASYIFNKIMTA